MKLVSTMIAFLFGATTFACNGICVGDFAYKEGHEYFSIIVGANPSEGTITLKNSRTGDVRAVADIALMKGCNADLTLCVGDHVRADDHTYFSYVVGIFRNGDAYIKNMNTQSNFRKSFNELSIRSRKSGERVCYFEY